MTSFDPSLLKDPRALRNAFGTFLTGVTVVTTKDAQGAPIGFTANSFTSVSLDPPLVLVCLANTSSNYDAFANCNDFAVNVLSEAQIDVSNTFARPAEDRFATVEWGYGPNGSPILGEVTAWFDCAMSQRLDAGDHLVLIGEVKAFDHNTAPGLGYARGAYVTPAAEAAALSKRKDMILSALIECNGRVLLCPDDMGWLHLPSTEDTADGVTKALARLIETTGAQADPGFIYSVFQQTGHDHGPGQQHISFLCHADGGDTLVGAFQDLNDMTLSAIADPEIRSMLERFSSERELGHFGVYFENEVTSHFTPKSLRS